MDEPLSLIVATVALAIVASLAWYVRARRAAADMSRMEISNQALLVKVDTLTIDLSEQKVAAALGTAAAQRVDALEHELKAERAKAENLHAENSGLKAEQQARSQAFDEKIATLTQLRDEIEQKLKALTADALKGNQESFLGLANELFAMHREGAVTELDQRKAAIEVLLTPLAQTLELYRTNLSEMEKARLEAYVTLTNELKGVAQAQVEVRTEATRLVNALRAAPKTRGRWGEHQLLNVLELAGMMEYVDIIREPTLAREDERLRPDAIIRMPGGRHLVVDAKTPMTAYLDAVDALDEETREAYLVAHARQLRHHMKQLSVKAYWDSLTVTPDFVVMFVPGENFFAAAIERDPELFEDAVAQRVLVTTPTTLVALAKAVAFGWRQEKVADNAKRVAELGRDLYKRLATMGDHFVGIGRNLERAVASYNSTVGSLESSVMPQARRFKELEVEGTQGDIPLLEPIDGSVRPPRPARDLIVSGDQDAASLLPATDEPAP